LLHEILNSVYFSTAQQRIYIAARTINPPKIDGKLTDNCWQNIAVATDFVTNDPEFGKPAAQKTEVKFIYDDDAIYLAYYLYDNEPEKIIKVLCERDKNIIADEIMLAIDTYGEKTSAFRLQLNAAGVQFDRFMSPFIPRSDRSWDAVWESAVSIDEKGWYAEIKIPLSALRYPKKPIQEWIIQFGRYVGRTGEFTTWSPVNNNIGGGPMRQWGLMKGIENIKPETRLSISPYFTVGVQKDPLAGVIGKSYTSKTFYTGGADLKYGINQSYTLDMSLVPDFSQVQSDNTILNLTPFEVKFEERRQFFTEGAEMFNKAGIFYSRRIGSVPSAYSSLSNNLHRNERILENPSVIGIINTTKISGRTKKGFGIGVLNAVTKNIYAKIINDSTGLARKLLTEPAANYNVLVIDQSLKNNSKIGIINTNVLRNGSSTDANVTALDFILNNKGSIYSLTGTAIYSYRKGEALPGGKQSGYNYKIDFAKISRNFRFEIFNTAVQKNYNPNDLGILTATNFMQNYFALKYFTITPKNKILNWNTTLSYTHTNTLSNISFQRRDIDWNSFILFKNFSTVTLATNWRPSRTIDIYEPRTDGKKFVRPKSFKQAIVLSTDIRKKNQLVVSGTVNLFEFPKQHFYYDFGLAPVFRIGNKVIISPSILYSSNKNNQGYVSTIKPDSIVFGHRQEQSIENIILLQYFFSAYHNLSFRARDYWSKIRYDQYFKLQDDGYLIPMAYGKNADINLNIFNIDMIYTWQFAPGSFLSASWKKNINFNNKSRDDGYFKNLSGAFDTPGSNSISIRMIYYLDYANIKKILR
jgi:hypothetical protein